MRQPPDSVNQRVAGQVQAWAPQPWALDFFAAMRRLEALSAPAPRWGEALTPGAESVRIGQEPSLSFAPAAVSRFEQADARAPRMRQHFFGYLGPNGPLPIHLSDFIRERALIHGDRTWLAFLDMLVHRFALHFYRAWTQARPAVSIDRPGEDLYRRWIGALVGIGTPARQQRDAIHDDARLHFSGWLVRRMHNAEAVESVLARYFAVPVRLQRWVGQWLPIAGSELSRLGASNPNPASRRLGIGVVVGRQVWDRQHKVRLYLGPLTLAQYRSFLPSGGTRPALRAWMKQLLGDELEWDAELILRKDQVPPTRLGGDRGSRLGWTSWLGERARTRDAADLRVPSSYGAGGAEQRFEPALAGSS